MSPTKIQIPDSVKESNYAISPVSVQESSSSSESTSSTTAATHNLHPMVTRAKNHISKPKVFANGTSRYPLSHAMLATDDLTIL